MFRLGYIKWKSVLYFLNSCEFRRFFINGKALSVTDSLFLSADGTIQAKEEEEVKQKLEEQRLLDKQKQELQGMFKRKHPHSGHLYQRPRKDSVERSTTLDSSENLFVKPVGRKPTAGTTRDEVIAL